MNRRNLFKFLGALPLLAITPKKEWGPLNPNPHPLLLEATIKHQQNATAEIFPKFHHLIRGYLDKKGFTNFPGEPKL